METNKYQLDNFVVYTEEEDGKKKLGVRDLMGIWRIEYTDSSQFYDYWLSVIGMAKEDKKVRIAVEATFAMLYQMSNVGIHDTEATNAFARDMHGLLSRLKKAIDETFTDDEREKMEKDDKEWMKDQDTIEKLSDELNDLENEKK